MPPRTASASPLDSSRPIANSRAVSSMRTELTLGDDQIVVSQGKQRESTSGTSPSAATASAASSDQPPANTATRRKTARSAEFSRSTLHCNVAWSECCRPGASCMGDAGNGSRRPSRSSVAATPSCAARGATSSIASGRPSRRTHKSATARAFSSVRPNVGATESALQEQTDCWHERQTIDRWQVPWVRDG